MRVVLASSNPGKIREFSEGLHPVGIEIIPQSALGIDACEENALTFVENALRKARHAAQIANLPAIADDSGLAVLALRGRPGIYSARFAGPKASAEENINQLLAELSETPDGARSAFFYCALVFIERGDDPTPLIGEGQWPGRILRHPQGQAGFGYDPIFYLPTLKKTAAELPIGLKNKISHRGIALQSLLEKLMKRDSMEMQS